ncbi:MAG: DUF5706 domain-containing protein [Tenericutes bacterium]|nr:DUF5706 domain-containing protein [Mycoplasmatota bacterium]
MQTKQVTSNYNKEYAFWTIERNISWINSADNKAAILLAFLSFLFGGSIFITDMAKIQEMLTAGNTNETLLAVGIIISALFLALSLIITPVLLILVIFSRTKSINRKTLKNVLFFNDISKDSYEEFYNIVKLISEDEILEDLVSQVYITSSIAHKKYHLLNLGYIAFITSIFLVLIYTFLVSLL